MTGQVKEYQFNAQGGVTSVKFITTPSGGPGSAAWGGITGTLSDQTDVYATITSRALIATLSSAAFAVSSMFAISTHTHSASDITSSTLALARMGTGSPNVSTHLDGTGAWSVPVYTNISSLPVLGTVASTAAALYALSSHSASAVVSSTFALARLGTGSSNVSTFLDGTGAWSQPNFSSLSNLPTLGTVASTNAILYALSSAAHIANYIDTSTFALARLGAGTTNVSTFLDGTQNFSQPVYGSLSGLPTIPAAMSTVKVTSIKSSTTTSSLPLTELAFSLVTGTNYAFNFNVCFATVSSNVGAKIGLTFPAVSTFGAQVRIPIAAAGAGGELQGPITASGGTVAGTGVATASTKYVAEVVGVINPTTTGTLQLTYGTGTAGQGVSTFVGSYGILTTL